MKVVEGQLAALIEEILVVKQCNSESTVRRIEGTLVRHFRPATAANDARYQTPCALVVAANTVARSWSIFFEKRVKTCAKSAQNAARFVKALAVNRRRRAALAACFFAFFSLFPSNTHSANLSTTPYIAVAE